MFRIVGRYLREQVERNVVRKKEKGENSGNRKRRCSTVYDRSGFREYLKRINKRFVNNQRVTVNTKENCGHKNRSNTFSTDDCLRDQWIETLGWSGTLAFGWVFSHNLHLLRRPQKIHNLSTLDSIYNLPLRKHLCPHLILKSILVSNVLAQPDEIVPKKSFDKNKDVGLKDLEKLPVYGPKTAEETLNEAANGLREVRDEAIGELENRLGLRCMFKQRYRKAVIHFAAGSALHNSAATFNLAQCYELGLGTSQDFEKAAKFYRTASDQGNAAAMYNLAVFYAHGYGGLKSDKSKAFELLEKACQLGEPAAKQLLQKDIIKNKSPSKTFTKKTEKFSPQNCENKLVLKKPKTLKMDSILTPFINENLFVVTNFLRKQSSSTSTDDGVVSANDSLVYSNESFSDSCSESKSVGSSSKEKDFKEALSVRCSKMRALQIRDSSTSNRETTSNNEYSIPLIMDMYKLTAASSSNQ